MKTATTIEKQIEILRSHGIIIKDEEKAKEILHDIGYYRLGFYFFPFEETYPKATNRDHKVVSGTLFEDAVKLYYFDFDLRNILNRYLTRVEVAFRTYLTYYMSLQYKTDPLWFVSPTVVRQAFIQDFDKKVYSSEAFITSSSSRSMSASSVSARRSSLSMRPLKVFVAKYSPKTGGSRRVMKVVL